MKKIFGYGYSLITLLLLVFFCSNVYGLQGSTAANGSNAQAVHDLGVTGEGIHIGAITGKNVLTTHLAFQDSNGVSHAINHDVIGTGFLYDVHDTPFTGIIISRGSTSHPNDIGVAPDAFVHCARVRDNGDVNQVLEYLIANQSCRIMVTGIQWSDTPNGQSLATLMYDYYAEANDIIFANAAGNNSNQITVYGDCYNGITTGGLEDDPATSNNDNYFRVGDVTNSGPTVDGRRKPDIMAPSTNQIAPGYSSGSNDYWNTGYGDGATSWAVPHIAGVAALLLQYANQTSDANAGHSEVIKAVIVNSTFPNINDEANNPTNPASPDNVWHNERGYGRVDALRAFQTLSAGRIIRNTTITAATGWAYDTMSSKATHIYYLEGIKNERLILTITWNRLVTKNGSTYYDENSPKFNINVTVGNPASEVIFYENDMLDNLEKVDLILPADGDYAVSLKNTTSKSRAYSLAFEILPPLTGDFDMNYIVNGLDLYQMVIDWLSAGPDTDIVPDGIVNWLDFTEFADNWLKTDPRYYNP